MNESKIAPVPDSTMRAPGSGLQESRFKQVSALDGAQMYALGIATVMQVDHATLHVTLRTENGDTFEHAPTALTFPGAGARHFLGALPCPGDVALIGWGANESGRSRQPYVLGWFASPVAGHDWWMLQPFGTEEYDLTPKDRTTFEGIANRTRYKLRHMLPGNIVASSSQGSDLVLDESVLLTNRRGNEILLRDQDQALVFRSLQQFHAGAGFRVYSGIVQRDALLLPSSMYTDGVLWDAPLQINPETGEPLTSEELGFSTKGVFAPNRVFTSLPNGFGGNVDPRVFLQKGLFVDSKGNALNAPPDAVSGGKATYRVSADGQQNAVLGSGPALTEYRLEVTHTSDGTLPVTEETDGFDADRLPETTSRLPGSNERGPFVEWVLGSVVGNDPFTLSGKPLYGIPLAVAEDLSLTSGLGRDVAEHAASLFRVRSVLNPEDQTFWSVLKNGDVRLSVAGDVKGRVAEEVSLSVGPLSVSTTALKLESQGVGEFKAKHGSLSIGTGLVLQSDTDVSIKAGRSVIFSANALSFQDSSSISLVANTALTFQAGDAINQVSKTRSVTSLGKTVETYSGPKDGSPANGPAREVTIATTPATGFPGGVADSYQLVYGDREEELVAGSHTTSILVGDATYQVGVGTWKAASGLNTLEASPSGITVTATTGAAVFQATAGQTTISGTMAVQVSSIGPVLIQGAAVTLAAPGGGVGGILSGSDLDPLSGLPLAVLGLGSATHLLA